MNIMYSLTDAILFICYCMLFEVVSSVRIRGKRRQIQGETVRLRDQRILEGNYLGGKVDKSKREWANFMMEYERLRLNETEERIVNGVPTSITELPWYTALINKGMQSCGGNLVTDRHVLTAAHCVTRTAERCGATVYKKIDTKNLSVRLGSTWSVRNGELIESSSIDLHPEFLIGEAFLYRDLAIITLKKKVELGETIRLAAIHPELKRTDLEKMAGKKCIIAGWGKLAYGGESSTQLRKLEATILSPKTCSAYYLNDVDPDVNICVLDQGKSACKGDSGGGLYCDKKLLGVVSWSVGCAVGNPVVFARVDNVKLFAVSKSSRCMSWIINPILLNIVVNNVILEI